MWAGRALGFARARPCPASLFEEGLGLGEGRGGERVEIGIDVRAKLAGLLEVPLRDLRKGG